MSLSRTSYVVALVLAAVARGGPPAPAEAPKPGGVGRSGQVRDDEIRGAIREDREQARAEFVAAQQAYVELVVTGLTPEPGAFGGEAGDRAARTIAGWLRAATETEAGLLAGVLDSEELRAETKRLRRGVTLGRVADRVRMRRQARERIGGDVEVLLVADGSEPGAGSLGESPADGSSRGEAP
jgi:hypothetical protein